VSDSGIEPRTTRHTAGVEMMFVFMLPALMIVGSIAAMAATGYWWLMGVAFAGALIATGLVAVTIFHYTDDPTEVTAVDLELSGQPDAYDPQPRSVRPRRHHRLALHH
jgi:hypothetical protein